MAPPRKRARPDSGFFEEEAEDDAEEGDEEEEEDLEETEEDRAFINDDVEEEAEGAPPPFAFDLTEGMAGAAGADEEEEVSEALQVGPAAEGCVADGIRWTPEETEAQFTLLYDEWFPPLGAGDGGQLDYGSRAVMAFTLFGFDAEAAGHPDRHIAAKSRFMALYDEVKLRFLTVMMEMTRHDMLSGGVPANLARRGKMRRLGEAIFCGYTMVRNAFRFASCHFEDDAAYGDPDPDLFKFTTLWDDMENAAPKARLYLFLLRRAYERHYRKHGPHLYRRVMADGRFVHAWEEAMSIKEFVLKEAPKEDQFAHWVESLTHLDAATEYLEVSVDRELPSLRIDRSTFSFRNGIYDGFNDDWHPFVSVQDESGTVRQEPIIVEKRDGTCGEPVAAKFFDVELDEDLAMLPPDRWDEIPTPALDKIMRHQMWHVSINDDDRGVEGGCEEVIFWFFVAIGRWMHPVGTDSWQMMPFFKGIGNTGKSSVLKNVLGTIYPKNLCEVISNEVEKGFGLEALKDCLSWYAPDIKENFNLSQTDLQSMISGEAVSIRRKHKIAETMIWTAPGWCSGNKLPHYNDNAGSVSRRWLVWEWMRIVLAPDNELEKMLVAETPNIILKANKAYGEALRLHGKKGIWTEGVLPEYFHRTKEHVQDATNALSQMLHAPEYLAFDRDAYMPLSDLGDLYKDFCRTHNVTPERWQADFYQTTLQVHGLLVSRRCRKPYPRPDGESKCRTYVIGCDRSVG